MSTLHELVADNVFALDVYDLGLVKLLLERQKGLDLLRAHYQQTPLDEHAATAAARHLTLLLSVPVTLPVCSVPF